MNPISSPDPGRSTVEARWQALRWRILPTVAIVVVAMVGFSSGVTLRFHETVSRDGWLAHLYYALGLFLFGGVDLGTPVDGPVYGQVALWTAYFVAPALTASAVLEAALRMGGVHLLERRLNRHVVIVGGGRLTRIYLRKLRDSAPDTPVLVLGTQGESAALQELQIRFGVHTLEGRATSRIVLRRLRLEHAKLVLVLSADDFANFDVATRMLKAYPGVEDKLQVHVHDLIFLRSISKAGLPVLKRVFNGHERAAKRLVRHQLLHHFQRTVEKNGIVLAGFGDFGQTVLHELQLTAAELFDRVVIVDTDARRHAATFQEQVGFEARHERQVIDGDIRNPDVWAAVADMIDLRSGEPVVVIGSGDDHANIRVAMTLAEKHPGALVIARNENQWSFAASLADVAKIKIVNVVQLVGESMPREWFMGPTADDP